MPWQWSISVRPVFLSVYWACFSFVAIITIITLVMKSSNRRRTISYAASSLLCEPAISRSTKHSSKRRSFPRRVNRWSCRNWWSLNRVRRQTTLIRGRNDNSNKIWSCPRWMRPIKTPSSSLIAVHRWKRNHRAMIVMTNNWRCPIDSLCHTHVREARVEIRSCRRRSLSIQIPRTWTRLFKTRGSLQHFMHWVYIHW